MKKKLPSEQMSVISALKRALFSFDLRGELSFKCYLCAVALTEGIRCVAILLFSQTHVRLNCISYIKIFFSPNHMSSSFTLFHLSLLRTNFIFSQKISQNYTIFIHPAEHQTTNTFW